MASLSLIKGYLSSESEEELEEVQQKTLRLPLPVLPTFGVHQSISRTPRTSCNVDSSGKIRNFAHEAGNWATYVALAFNPKPLISFVEHLHAAFSSLNMEIVEDWHISLTRVVVLKHHWIDDFVKSVGNIIKNMPNFPIIMSGLSVYTNDQKTRTFLGLDMTSGQNEVDLIVNELDSLLDEYNLPKYYENRCYHISLLWASGDVSAKVNTIISNLSSLSPVNKCLDSYVYNIQDMYCVCKAGNKVFHFDLA